MFSSMAFFALLFTDKSTSEIFIRGCLGIVELLVIMYIGTTTVDRSEILANLGKSMQKNAEANDSHSRQIEPPRMPQQPNEDYSVDDKYNTGKALKDFDKQSGRFANRSLSDEDAKG